MGEALISAAREVSMERSSTISTRLLSDRAEEATTERPRRIPSTFKVAFVCLAAYAGGVSLVGAIFIFKRPASHDGPIELATFRLLLLQNKSYAD